MKSPSCSRNPDFWRIAKACREKPLQCVTRAASSTLGSCSVGEGRVVCEPQWQHLRGPKLTRQKCEKQTGCHKRLMLFLTICGCCCLKGPIVTFYCYCFLSCTPVEPPDTIHVYIYLKKKNSIDWQKTAYFSLCLQSPAKTLCFSLLPPPTTTFDMFWNGIKT